MSLVRAAVSTHRAQQDRDGQWPQVALDPTRYALDALPATVAALAGGSFHVSAVDGDLNERRLLAHTGFRSVIAAGGRPSTDDPHNISSTSSPSHGSDHDTDTNQDPDHEVTPGPASSDVPADVPGAWLVEVYGDALTSGLDTHEALLTVLTTTALTEQAPTG